MPLTGWLRRWSDGEEGAADEVFRHAYSDLRGIAARCLYGSGGGSFRGGAGTLQPTALVNEAYLRYQARTPVAWESRQQFFAYSARIIRQLLVDHARRRLRAKRGGGEVKLQLQEEWMEPAAGGGPGTVDLIDLHRALHRLAEYDEEKAAVVELRFFAGLTTDEIAEVIGVSRITVLRQWRRARAWLFAELTDGAAA